MTVRGTGGGYTGLSSDVKPTPANASTWFIETDTSKTYIWNGSAWTEKGGAGGSLTDGDKGDITVADAGATWTIDAGAITYAKLQDISATDRLLGRDSASSGDAEELTVGGGVEFTGSGGIQRSALTGDVTASAGNNATTIANDAVSNAKLANMAANTIKGNNTAGSADPVDLTLVETQRLITPAGSNTAGPGIANTETVVVSYVCAANELRAGTTFLVQAWTTQAGTNAATPTVRIRVGTTTLTGNIAATLTGAAGTSNVPSQFTGLITVRSAGAGGTVIGGLTQWKSGVATAANALTGTVAVDTTAASQRIELTFISGNAGNTYTFQVAAIAKIVP